MVFQSGLLLVFQLLNRSNSTLLMVFQVLSQSKSGKPLIQSIVGQQWKNPQKVLRKLLQNVSSKATFYLTKKALLQKVQEKFNRWYFITKKSDPSWRYLHHVTQQCFTDHHGPVSCTALKSWKTFKCQNINSYIEYHCRVFTTRRNGNVATPTSRKLLELWMQICHRSISS